MSGLSATIEFSYLCGKTVKNFLKLIPFTRLVPFDSQGRGLSLRGTPPRSFPPREKSRFFVMSHHHVSKHSVEVEAPYSCESGHVAIGNYCCHISIVEID